MRQLAGRYGGPLSTGSPAAHMGGMQYFPDTTSNGHTPNNSNNNPGTTTNNSSTHTNGNNPDGVHTPLHARHPTQQQQQQQPRPGVGAQGVGAHRPPHPSHPAHLAHPLVGHPSSMVVGVPMLPSGVSVDGYPPLPPDGVGPDPLDIAAMGGMPHQHQHPHPHSHPGQGQMVLGMGMGMGVGMGLEGSPTGMVGLKYDSPLPLE